MSELFLIRHGQASFDADDYDQLSPLGERQSVLLGEYFAAQQIHFDLLACGSLRRHRQTLNGICRGLGQTMEGYSEQPGIDEYDFRTLTSDYVAAFADDPLWLAVEQQPRDKSAYYRLLRRVLMAWQDERFATRAESYQQFVDRVAAVSAWLQQQSQQHRRIAIVGSGGSLALFIGAVLGLAVEQIVDLNLQTKNTALHRCYLNRDTIKLASWNNTPHLDPIERHELVTYG